MVYIQFKKFKANDLIPHYRYIVFPVKATSTKDIINRAKGYLTLLTNFPAKLQNRPNAGAVYSDWQFCLECFGGYGSIEKLSAKQISYIKSMVKDWTPKLNGTQIYTGKYIERFYVRDSLKQIPRSFKVGGLSGNEGKAAYNALNMRLAELSGDMSKLKYYDLVYQNYIKNTVMPTTFDYWAKQQNCPANYLELHWVDNQIGNSHKVVKQNTRYLKCRSKALEKFDIKNYLKQQPAMYQMATTYWNKSSKTTKFHEVNNAKQLAENLKRDFREASRELKAAHEQIEINAQHQRNMANAKAYVKQNWANTFSSIQSRNDAIIDSFNQTNRMISNAQALQRIEKIKDNNMSHDSHTHSGKLTSQTQQDSRKTAPVKENNNTKTASGASSSKSAEKSKPNKPANAFVGAGRDYSFTGTSKTYYSKSTAMDLAKTNLRNQAAKFCKDTYKTKISWPDAPKCKPHNKDNTFLCTVDAKINCYQQRCDKEYCGTRN